ncbi:MAG: hypothetical protein ACR2RL_00690 [Gammaproteobacteria bacterium]
MSLCTVFRSENAYTTLQAVEELRDFTGLEIDELVTFRPQRLVVHELLIRVTADLSVSDGSQYEDLGINFRRVTRIILSCYIEPHLPALEHAYEALRLRIESHVDEEIGRLLGREEAPDVRAQSERRSRTGLGAWVGILRRAPRTSTAVEPSSTPSESLDEREARAIARWQERSTTSEDPAAAAACRALAAAATAIRSRQGRLWGDGSLLGRVACGLACNEQGSVLLGEMIQPYILEAAPAEGLELLAAQAKPVVMNTKGASAAGKSTLRPVQKRLAERIGVRWQDFALISPDIWRKFLLDYESLGETYKYAGTFTGHELGIVDRKLDRYMARKAQAGRMSHLLVDRFRFDSFATSPNVDGSSLLTRFGHVVYMFFMITPPEATVERAWQRGLDVGRYKAVDDLLDHNIEAYTGMPQLFLALALRSDRPVHYEFLDNSVALGERPRTIAFGRNAEMNILDVRGMLNIDRFRKIDVDATGPTEVYPDPSAMAPERNLEFLIRCASSMAKLNFADRDSARVYARFENGALAGICPELLRTAVQDADTRAAILALAPDVLGGASSPAQAPRTLNESLGEDAHTVGRWGRNGKAARAIVEAD